MVAVIALAWAVLAGPVVAIDGDTLRAGRERVRLLGVDAPELPGHCRRGRRCVAGDPVAARVALATAIRGPVRIQRFGHDHYGRTLAIVEAGGRDVACRQIDAGHAVYQPRYDRRGLVARRCRVALR